jgi:outer membrane protein OmpA-like peptidoglycan-associated protein
VQIVMEGALGGKVLEIRPPEQKPGQPAPDLAWAEEDTLLVGEPSSEMGDLVNRAGGALERLPTMIDEGVNLFKTTRDTAARGKQTLDKIETTVDSAKKLPLVGRAFEGPADILVRERGEWERRVFAEKELFEPGHAVLTAGGRERLDDVGAWLKQQRHSGSEVVVVGYADPAGKATPENARRITKQQSEAVLEYLKKHHKAHKLAWYSVMGIASRRVYALGLGTSGPPKPEKEAMPAARVEVLLYKPQS